MPGERQGATSTLASSRGAASVTSPALVPCLLLRRGEVCLPGDQGPEPARTQAGARYDPFDVLDRLAADYPLVYVVDLDGVERGEPQLDLLQELSRDAALWVDGGVRNAEQAIDILVSGAQRAVLSSATLRSPRELRRSWRLSTELVFEADLGPAGLVIRPEWETGDPLALVRSVREVGVDHIVLSPREIAPDWSLVAAVAAAGPTWVDGSFERDQLDRLRQCGASGGIFHIADLLPDRAPVAPSPPLPSQPSGGRDDET